MHSSRSGSTSTHKAAAAAAIGYTGQLHHSSLQHKFPWVCVLSRLAALLPTPPQADDSSFAPVATIFSRTCVDMMRLDHVPPPLFVRNNPPASLQQLLELLLASMHYCCANERATSLGFSPHVAKNQAWETIRRGGGAERVGAAGAHLSLSERFRNEERSCAEEPTRHPRSR